MLPHKQSCNRFCLWDTIRMSFKAYNRGIMDYSILKNFLDSENKLKALPSKRKIRVYALHYLAGKFEADRVYTEKEVNRLLNMWHTFGDPATLRRELYDNGFINRQSDCRSYWLEAAPPSVDGLT